jgi:hypothetical protein
MSKDLSLSEFYLDSSDEEDIAQQDKEFDLAAVNVDFDALSKELGAEKSQVIKSFLLHNLGRMIIFSPQIDVKYREYKEKYLDQTTSLKTKEETDKRPRLQTNDFVGQVTGLEDLIVLGRLLRRSQVRLYKKMNKEFDDEIKRCELLIQEKCEHAVEDSNLSLNQLFEGAQLKPNWKEILPANYRKTFIGCGSGRYHRVYGIEEKNISEEVLQALHKANNKLLYRQEQRIDAEIEMISRNQTSGSVVGEELVASYNGLGSSTQDRSKSNTDMVDLRGTGGSYKASFKDQQFTHGKVGVDHTTQAAKKVKTENPDELKQALEVITSLKGEIAEQYPRVNQDAFIAESIRKICRAEPLQEGIDPKIVDQIYALTYLLFKTEVFRSPAALINNMQMLDLMINGQMTLEDAFNKEEMPMSPIGAIKAARKLQEKYEGQKKFFYRYENPFSYASGYDNAKFMPNNLVDKEANLMDRWLKLRFGEKKFEEINANFETFLPEIVREINNGLQAFGLNVHSQSFFKAMSGASNPERVKAKPSLNQNDIKYLNGEDVKEVKRFITERGDQIKPKSAVRTDVNDSERFAYLWFAAHDGKFNCVPDFQKGVVTMIEIYDHGRLSNVEHWNAFCPINSIAIGSDNCAEEIKKFINNPPETPDTSEKNPNNSFHNLYLSKYSGTVMIFSIIVYNQYKVLAIDPQKKQYRYIDPMRDSKNGEIEDEKLREELKNMGFNACDKNYQKQQFSDDVSEGAFHSSSMTVHMARQKNISADMTKMSKDAFALDDENPVITSEIAKNKIMPVFEKVLTKLQEKINAKKRLAPSTAPSRASSSGDLSHQEEESRSIG